MCLRKVFKKEGSRAEADPFRGGRRRSPGGGPGAREVKGENVQKSMVHSLETGGTPPTLRAHYREPKHQCLGHHLRGK